MLKGCKNDQAYYYDYERMNMIWDYFVLFLFGNLEIWKYWFILLSSLVMGLLRYCM